MRVKNQLHKNYLTRRVLYRMPLRTTSAVDYGMLAIQESHAPFPVTRH